MDILKVFLWAIGNTRCPGLEKLFEEFEEKHQQKLTRESYAEDLIYIGYLFAKHEHKEKWNAYQTEWRNRNRERTRAHTRKYAAKKGVAEKKREYAKKNYQKRKQQQKKIVDCVIK